MGLSFKYRRYVSGNWAKPLSEHASKSFEEKLNLQFKDIIEEINKTEGYILAYYSDDGNSILNWIPVNLSPDVLKKFDNIKNL